jgi:hypothetical protein
MCGPSFRSPIFSLVKVKFFMISVLLKAFMMLWVLFWTFSWWTSSRPSHDFDMWYYVFARTLSPAWSLDKLGFRAILATIRIGHEIFVIVLITLRNPCFNLGEYPRICFIHSKLECKRNMSQWHLLLWWSYQLSRIDPIVFHRDFKNSYHGTWGR